MFFETHAHYDSSDFDNDRDTLLLDLHENKGVSHIVNIGANMSSSKRSIDLSDKYEFIYASVGVHPHDAKKVTPNDYDTLSKWLLLDKVVALGEVGLDFHYDFSPRDLQEEVFKNQLKLLTNITKPVIIHSREANGKVFDILKQSNVRNGIIHAYSGSTEMALDYIDMGYHIGVGGVITFKNAKNLVDVVKSIPLDKILIETDSPYLTPCPFRGTRNNSQYLEYIVNKISEIKQIPTHIVEETTLQTALKIFCLN